MCDECFQDKSYEADSGTYYRLIRCGKCHTILGYCSAEDQHSDIWGYCENHKLPKKVVEKTN